MELEYQHQYKSFNLNSGVNRLKKKAIKEYYEALKMPRKKKKQAKKSALLLYSVACWEPEF